METNNPKYKGQGIHVMSSIFTVERGIAKILLIQRKNNPFYGMWALPGGALYNDENLEDAVMRELFEKTGLEISKLQLCNVFGDVNRSPSMRMVGISYLGVVDQAKVNLIKETLKTSNADWFRIDNLPKLAYDHKEIIEDALEKLKVKIIDSNILEDLFPEKFTLPELQKAYEAILNKNFDRRNFRKKLLSLDIIEDINETATFEGKKPAKLYRFKKNKTNKIIL